MAQDLSATQKADQIAHHFFSKFALIVDNARAPVEPRDSATAKIDKWFNIETPDSEKYKDHLRAYRSISTLSSPPPPFELQVLLTIPELTNNQVLVLHDPPASRVRVDPTPSHILLESWQLEFAPSPAWYSSGTNTSGEVTLSAVYKHGICLYRSLFALLRVLPTWRLYQRLRRRGAGLGPTRNGALGIEMRIGPLSTDTDGSHILGFGEHFLSLLFLLSSSCRGVL
ncbi:hypothetical protein BD410DRAFT_728253 [Rickenella mellea]|uniref:Autophagy-related protein 13 n=1 Tax=Rickenella mellea TaxID=50990 RepID=A0A4Y7PUU5_9AGAM|nr:hypothetical protein BD410DRAFT_728253 [Rickenella mellea]